MSAPRARWIAAEIPDYDLADQARLRAASAELTGVRYPNAVAPGAG
jgi:hypothetical protein